MLSSGQLQMRQAKQALFAEPFLATHHCFAAWIDRRHKYAQMSFARTIYTADVARQVVSQHVWMVENAGILCGEIAEEWRYGPVKASFRGIEGILGATLS